MRLHKKYIILILFLHFSCDSHDDPKKDYIVFTNPTTIMQNDTLTIGVNEQHGNTVLNNIDDVKVFLNGLKINVIGVSGGNSNGPIIYGYSDISKVIEVGSSTIIYCIINIETKITNQLEVHLKNNVIDKDYEGEDYILY